MARSILSRASSSVGWLPLALLAAGCASQSNTVKAALYGDLPALRAEIERSRRQGSLDKNGVVELSLALAEREVASAQGSPGALRIRSLRPCSAPLRDSLKQRAEQHDDAAAEALLILLESGALDRAELIRRYARASSGAFRALAARSAIHKRDVLERRRFFEDPDERVRRAAFSAALEAPEIGDLSALLDAARLDPDPQSQSLAARAAGALGGEQAVLGLRDLWARSAPALRFAIIHAWTFDASYGAGGEQALIWAAEKGAGLESIAAAAALADKGSQNRGAALTLLARAMGEGSDDERELAIRLAPAQESSIVRALLDAQKSAPARVRVVALERLARLTEHKQQALGGLKSLERGTDDSAAEARAALARLGDTSIATRLADDLKAKSAPARRRAAGSLIALGRYEPAASVLADDDPDVRLGVACSILAANY